MGDIPQAGAGAIMNYELRNVSSTKSIFGGVRLYTMRKPSPERA